MTKLSISGKLNLIKSRKKLPKKQLADLRDIHWSRISKYNKNETTPSIEAIKKLAIPFDISSDYLIFDYPPIKPDISNSELFEIMVKLDNLSSYDRQSHMNKIHFFIGSKEGA